MRCTVSKTSKLSKQLCYIYYVLYIAGRLEVRWARDLICVMEGGRCGYMEKLLLYCITAY